MKTTFTKLHKMNISWVYCQNAFFVDFELSQHKHSLLYALSLPKRTRPYIRIIIKIKKNLSHILT